MDQKLRDEYFPSFKDISNLNNASEGTPPNSALEAMKEYFQGRINGSVTIKDIISMFTRFYDKIASFIGGLPEEYALMPNTTEGINAAAHSIDYPPGSNIVIADLEFPANYIPWHNLKQFYDVEIKTVKSKDGAVPIEAFLEKIDNNTRIVGVSHVQFATGYRTDLKELTGIAHDHGGLILADIIQSAGALDLNVKKLNLDFAAGQATKWLLGPIGAGFLFVNENIIDQVKPRFAGWWGVEDMENFSYMEREFLPNAKKFQVGSPAIVCYYGFLESLEFLNTFAAKDREFMALNVADYLREKLEDIGINYFEFEPEHRSPIISCKPVDLKDLHKQLVKNKIFTSVRGGRLRISPHFYNNQQEIDKLIEIISQ